MFLLIFCERGREGERNIQVKETVWLPPICALTGDRTPNGNLCALIGN